MGKTPQEHFRDHFDGTNFFDFLASYNDDLKQDEVIAPAPRGKTPKVGHRRFRNLQHANSFSKSVLQRFRSKGSPNDQNRN